MWRNVVTLDKYSSLLYIQQNILYFESNKQRMLYFSLNGNINKFINIVWLMDTDIAWLICSGYR